MANDIRLLVPESGFRVMPVQAERAPSSLVHIYILAQDLNVKAIVMKVNICETESLWCRQECGESPADYDNAESHF